MVAQLPQQWAPPAVSQARGVQPICPHAKQSPVSCCEKQRRPAAEPCAAKGKAATTAAASKKCTSAKQKPAAKCPFAAQCASAGLKKCPFGKATQTTESSSSGGSSGSTRDASFMGRVRFATLVVVFHLMLLAGIPVAEGARPQGRCPFVAFVDSSSTSSLLLSRGQQIGGPAVGTRASRPMMIDHQAVRPRSLLMNPTVLHRPFHLSSSSDFLLRAAAVDGTGELATITPAEQTTSAAATAAAITAAPTPTPAPAPTKRFDVAVVGLSHHRAPLDVREKLAVPEAQWNNVSKELCALEAVEEALILSTCNRFEVYFSTENMHQAMTNVLSYLKDRSGIDQETLRKHLFLLQNDDAVQHILRVSGGLDSLVLGECQILSQVKQAHAHAIEKDGSGGKVITRLFNTAIAAGKRVRSETGISKGSVSVSSAAVEFTRDRIDGDLKKPFDFAKLAIIGAGKMSRLMVTHMISKGVKKVTVVNRNLERAEELKAACPGIEIDIRPLDDMWDVIAESDVVYTSTSAQEPIVTADKLQAAVKGRPIMLIDISVPRNVHSDCETLEGVRSYHVDHLKAVVDKNTAMRRKEIIQAEKILLEEASKYDIWAASLGAVPAILKLQEKAEEYRQAEVKKATRKLNTLTEEQLEAVEQLSKGIVNKLISGPVSTLRTFDAAALGFVKEAYRLDI